MLFNSVYTFVLKSTKLIESQQKSNCQTARTRNCHLCYSRNNRQAGQDPAVPSRCCWGHNSVPSRKSFTSTLWLQFQLWSWLSLSSGFRQCPTRLQRHVLWRWDKHSLHYCREHKWLRLSTTALEPDPAADGASSPDTILKHSNWPLNGGTATSFRTSGVMTHRKFFFKNLTYYTQTQRFWKHYGCAHQNSTYKLNF